MRVLRHPIGIVDHQVVALPSYGELLSVAVARGPLQDRSIDVWSVDYEQGTTCEVDVFVVGTGNPIGEKAQEAVRFSRFLGTVVTPSGLVWHVWQGKIR